MSADSDLRPKYQMVDSLKYDALVCPHCGYAALSRFFKFMLPAQAKMIRENITANFKGIDTSASTYSYDDAIMRHQLALANAVVKKAKTSEKAYTCLKMAWLYRGKAENLPKDSKDYQTQIIELKKQELELLKNACEGFKSAYSKETFPMCGMDEITMMYLIADLCRRIGHFDESKRWISSVLTSRGANERIKNKARDLKDMVEEGCGTLVQSKTLNCFIFAMLHKKMRTSRKTCDVLFLLYRKLLVSYKVKNAPRGCASRGEEVSCKQHRSSAKESQATLCSAYIS